MAQHPIDPIQGGTGVINNNASTITISGDYPVTLTLTASTNVTLPTSGTLLTSANGVSSFNTRTGAVTLTLTDVTTAVPDVSSFTNDAGYLTAITGVSSFNTRTGAVTLTSGDVTTALTFTPYNATNPSEYITSADVNNTTVLAAIGYTPVNKAGDTMAGALNMASYELTGLATPSASSDAATKAYVDAATTAVNVHPAADVFADGTNTLITGATYTVGTTGADGGNGVGAVLTAAAANVALVVDTHTVAIDERVLVNSFTNGTSPSKQNGIYYMSQLQTSLLPWILTRSTDYDNSTIDEVTPGDYVFIKEGSVYKSTSWVETDLGSLTPPTYQDDAIKIGTDDIYFTQFGAASSYAAGTGLTLTGTTFAVNFGAGIEQLPTNDIGVNLYAPTNGGLILTTDGSTRSTLASAALYLLTTARLTQSSSGLDLASGIVSAGTYTSVTVDTYGRVTAGSSPSSTPALTATYIGYGNGSNLLTGTSDFTWTEGTSPSLTVGTANVSGIVSIIAPTSSSTTGTGISVIAGAVTSNNTGGSVNITGGANGGSGSGLPGNVNITGGSQTGTAANVGGNVNITGGSCSANLQAGGNISITSGKGSSNSISGSVSLTSGIGQLYSGPVTIGVGTSAGGYYTTGNLTLQGGNVTYTGAAASQVAGNIVIIAGTAATVSGGTSVAGSILFQTAPVSVGPTALTRFQMTPSGALVIGATSTNYGTSGQVLTSAGNAAPTWSAAPASPLTNTYIGYGAGGVLTGTSDFTYTTGADPSLYISGTTLGYPSGTSAAFTIQGPSGIGAAASINITGGSASTGSVAAGSVTITGGGLGGYGGVIGGNVSLSGSTGNGAGAGGTASMAGGHGGSTGNGGSVTISAGTGGTSATGGSVTISSGPVTSGTAGTIILQTGTTTSVTALTIAAAGNVTIATPSSGYSLNLPGNGYGLAIAGTSGQNAAAEFGGNGNVVGTNSLFVGQSGAGVNQILGRNNANLTIGTNATVGMITLAAAGNVTIAAPSSGDSLTTTGVAGSYAATFKGANSTTGYALDVVGNYTGAGNQSLASFVDVNNTNGVNIELTGNGGTTPTKYIKVSSGNFYIVNSAYTTDIITLTDAGSLTIPNVLSAGASVAQGSPSATVLSTNAHTLLSGQGGNYLAFGQYSGTHDQWIQSAYTDPTTATYNIVLQPLGGNVGIGTDTVTYALTVNGTAAATVFNATSDANKKTNITKIDDATSIINNLNGVRFNWKDTGAASAGLIAQDVEKVMPELVETDGEGTKSMNYNGIIGALVEAIKDLSSQLSSIKSELETLKNK